jgi:hypothetical protein
MVKDKYYYQLQNTASCLITVQLELPPHPNHIITNPHVDDAVTFQNSVMSLMVITSTGRLLVLDVEKL